MSKQFECHKSFYETEIFTRGEERIEYEMLWTFATLVYQDNEAPPPDVDGNYLNIDLGRFLTHCKSLVSIRAWCFDLDPNVWSNWHEI